MLGRLVAKVKRGSLVEASRASTAPRASAHQLGERDFVRGGAGQALRGECVLLGLGLLLIKKG